jgi:hypothetical protein
LEYALQQLSACDCWSGAETGPDAIEKARMILPKWFWMVKASAPELFSATRRKFREVLLSVGQAVPKPMDFSLLLALRLPGHSILMVRPSCRHFRLTLSLKNNALKTTRVENNAQSISIGQRDHSTG